MDFPSRSPTEVRIVVRQSCIATRLPLTLITSLPGVSALRDISPGETPGPAITNLLSIAKLPSLVKWVMATALRWFSRPAGRNDVFARLLTFMGPQTVPQERLLVLRREQYRAAWNQAMRKQGIDLVLLPIFALPPIPMGGSGTATLIAANYAFLFNIVSLFCFRGLYADKRY